MNGLVAKNLSHKCNSYYKFNKIESKFHFIIQQGTFICRLDYEFN